MIFAIFLFLFALSIILIVAGFGIDIPLFAMIGAVLLIGLGGLVMAEDIQIVSGENTTNIIENNVTVGTTTIDVYESYSWGEIGGTAYGWFFLILGVGLFIITLTMLGD